TQPFAAQLVHLGEIQGWQRVHAESPAEQVVGEFRVAGQGGAVHVGAEDRPLHHTFEAVADTVADAAGHPCEAGGGGSEGGPAAVVLESGERGRQPGQQWCGGDLADRTGALRGGGGVQQPDTLYAFAAGGFVPLAEYLDRRADGQDRGAATGRCL